MRTSEYDWYRPDFYEYNVAQQAVIPFCDQEFNLVVSFPTAVGKSVIAECCFGYHLAHGQKVAYVAPYRSLCSEKFDKWRDDFQLNVSKVAIRTGDRTSSDAKMKVAGLTVMTSESFDGRTRVGKWESWIKSLSCVVFDEAHMIGDPQRGAAVECAMMRLTDMNPDCRLVLLSATMDNAVEVARWVRSLSGKKTKCFKSDWRPNEVEVEQYYENGWDDIVETVVERMQVGLGKKIVFVHSKRIGKTILKKARQKGIKAYFHNASASKGVRRKIESMFDDPNSGLDVIISTSTLGAGVNIGVVK